jgi:hypothetical protein
MAGLALTNDFMLSTATVMIGAQAELNDLNPTDHSIGLVKNFTMTSEPSYVELMQGVKGSIVHSTMTANPVRASMEVYEYTAKNLAYSLGIDGTGVAAKTSNTTVATLVPASPAQNTLVLTSATGFTQGQYILIEVDTVDNFVIRKIVSVATNTLTLDENLPAIASGVKVYLVNSTDIGSKEDQPFFSCKVAGKFANGSDVVILIPKIRITKGFNLAFIQNDYANLPFEFQVYDLVSTDPHYADFGSVPARIFRR